MHKLTITTKTRSIHTNNSFQYEDRLYRCSEYYASLFYRLKRKRES